MSEITKGRLRLLLNDGKNAAKEESVEESTSQPHVSVTLLDLDVLECPICCEPLKIPIFQCENGHLACSLCCNKVKNVCPSCKLPIGYSRCRAMERVIEASRESCPNSKHGCKETFSYGNFSSHEKQCLFSLCSCPMHDCSYTGSYDGLKNHVSVKHKEGPILFTWDTPLSISMNKKLTIFKEKNDGQLIVLQGFNTSPCISFNMSCIVPLATEIGRFSCSLELITSRSSLKQRLLVKTFQKRSDEQLKEDFMLIPSYMWDKGTGSFTGSLTFTICISRGDSQII